MGIRRDELTQKIKLAVPTEGDKGIEDAVSEVFGRAKTFTLVEISDGAIGNVQAVKNPAASYKHGAGPVVVKTLADMGVNAVAAREFGPGASTLLDQHDIKKFSVKAGISVDEAVKQVLNLLKESE